jgi:hypothetical protein
MSIVMVQTVLWPASASAFILISSFLNMEQYWQPAIGLRRFTRHCGKNCIETCLTGLSRAWYGRMITTIYFRFLAAPIKALHTRDFLSAQVPHLRHTPEIMILPTAMPATSLTNQSLIIPYRARATVSLQMYCGSITKINSCLPWRDVSYSTSEWLPVMNKHRCNFITRRCKSRVL